MHRWWQRGIVYQIYPRSFQDSNGDGIGDLNGIRERLGYLRWLGVDTIWISPFYPSPMADFGYDVSDYTGIDPIFGTMEDFDALVADAHSRDIKVILDFVPNHTSVEHPWFKESRSSRTSAKRNWYLWRDPKPGGGEPNNWLSNFGGPAWTYDKKTGQYYYHAFLPDQPDLNWRNPEVQQAMLDAMRLWFERGVDGFRVDVIWHIVKDEEFRDNPANPAYLPSMQPNHAVLSVYNADRPEVHGIITRMRDLADSYPDHLLIGEIYLPVERLVTYYGSAGSGVHLPFNFQLLLSAWNAQAISSAVDGYEAALPEHGWPNWVLGNHDNPRIATRVGAQQARVAAMLLLTLRGTPTMYYGDEIGMQNVCLKPEHVQDPFEKRVPGMGFGRDPERTPMQWDASAFAGFSTSSPWLPVSSDYEECNVEKQKRDSGSMLSFYRKLISLRQSENALSTGGYERFASDADVFVYVRSDGVRRFLIALNFGSVEQTIDNVSATLKLSTFLDREGERIAGGLFLRGNEGIVAALD
jgi:alpha-glucosidase